MPNSPIRLIIDTNLWISFLITKDYSKLNSLLLSGRIILIFSSELLEEFVNVSQRPKLQKYFSQSDIQLLTELIDSYAEFVSVKTNVAICRDEKDNFLLSLAVDSNASYLLTGDKDLLELKSIEETSILTITDFFNQVTS
jgi:putative PIN family toxin of toxin-antitoxin system